jgi:hypothetical protein
MSIYPKKNPHCNPNTSRLPPIHPTRTIHTPPRLLTNILPTKPTLNLLLHDIIIRPPRIRQRKSPQRKRNTNKPYNLIQETPIRKHYGAVVEGLLDGVVAVRDVGVVLRAVL